jgi:hypothetical protein
MEKKNISQSKNTENFPLFILTIYIILKPFYLFPSGGMQIADIFLIVLFFSLIVSVKGIKIYDWATVSLLLLLFMTITIVSGLWTLITEDLRVLLPILFLLFNLILFLCVSHIVNTHPSAKKTILWAIIGSVLLQFILIPISSTPAFRQSLFFNNPNQLGYWSVLCATIFLFLVQEEKLNKYIYIMFTGVVMILAGLSLSKAAIVSIFLLYFIYYSNRPIVGILFLISIIGTFLFAGEIEQVSNVVDRLADLGSAGDDNASGRGYNRIWEWPEYAWLGNGEGALERFGEDHEIHSTMGTLFFSYGPIGLFLFLTIFIRFFFTKGLASVLPFIPIFAYSLTHQGYRFSLFWLLLSLVSTYKYKQKTEATVAQLKFN